METLAQPRPLLGRLPFAALAGATATFGSRATRRGMGPWYTALRKPWFQPPKAVFGPVWTVLYGLMADSAYHVYRAPRSRARSLALTLWGAQLIANGSWSWLFFQRKRPKAALKDVKLLGALVAAYTWAARAVDRRAAREMLPYLAWLGFAGLLNRAIVRRNRLLAAR